MRRMVIAALLLAACGNPRSEAAAELRRLDDALRRHRAEHGRYPAAIDPARPAGADNLPHAPEGGVTLRLERATADGYQATARLRQWRCWMIVGPGQPGEPDCAPLSASAADE